MRARTRLDLRKWLMAGSLYYILQQEVRNPQLTATRITSKHQLVFFLLLLFLNPQIYNQITVYVAVGYVYSLAAVIAQQVE